MTRQDVENNIGKDVNVMGWYTDPKMNNKVTGKVWKIVKLTKGGLAMLKFNKETISVPPFYVEPYDY